LNDAFGTAWRALTRHVWKYQGKSRKISTGPHQFPGSLEYESGVLTTTPQRSAFQLLLQVPFVLNAFFFKSRANFVNAQKTHYDGLAGALSILNKFWEAFVNFP
jgi:hypothetical protein